MIMNEEEKANENKKETVKTKIDFFRKEKIKCHIDKYDRSWLNGFFTKKFITADKKIMYSFLDDVLGEQHIAFDEIRDVNTFREPKKGVPFRTNNF